MTYTWQINVDYQNNNNIVVNDNTSIVLSVDEIVYVDHGFEVKCDDVMSFGTIIILDLTYIAKGILIANAACDQKNNHKDQL
jgi:hypothetical protein